MTSLSRIIKSNHASQQVSEDRTIKIRTFSLQQEDIEEAAMPEEITSSMLLEEASMEAERIIEKANQQAWDIIQEANLSRERWEQEEKPMLMQAAREEGFQRGYEAGQQQGYKEMAESIAFAKDIVQSSKNDYRIKIESSEKTILELGLKVAERIIGLKLDESEEAFYSIVKRAIREAREYDEVQLHVNPVHYGFLLTQKDELEGIFPRQTDLFIYPDEQMDEHSCYIESSNGRINASVDSQLLEVKQKLIELLEGEDQ
ncbi:flagellar assembly protein FliH [Peribacillus saganii]|uniref:Flagellar assembly protein FliH n=1 Tax=Peribacillus saganii TaxID=2303992 RepID=A0A372LST0_9BACI|nr:flagellar assembly protein FliH [Peribacillus saganii]RFU71285.1 flagellar assembly protein FliH [Peribacillus saganii]